MSHLRPIISGLVLVFVGVILVLRVFVHVWRLVHRSSRRIRGRVNSAIDVSFIG